MRWGLVPSFTKKGDKPDFFRMFNARSETAAEKPSFRRLVGRRHGVVAFTGFYEWKRDEKGERQPYYFHYADDRPLLFAVLYDTWQQGGDAVQGYGNGGGGEAGSSSSSSGGGGGIGDGKAVTTTGGGGGRADPAGGGEGGLRGQAALLEREVEEEDRGGSLMFSYAVLTTKAAPRLEWLHERMPVILRGAQDAAAWMSCKGQEASKFLKSHTPYSGEDLVWHPVSKQMNTMRRVYDAEDCSAAIELKKPGKPLPAITTFFKKREPHEQQQQLASPGRRGGGGGGGGSESRGGTQKRRYLDMSDGDATPPEKTAAGVSSSVSSTTSPPATTGSGAAAAMAKALRTGAGAGAGGEGEGEIEGVWGRRGVGMASAAPLNPKATSSPGLPAAGSGKKKARTGTATGSPSPRKGSSKAAGAAAAAAAARDKRQSKLTAFFGTPSK
ncbi:unnamed protein product [Ectocarpus sp. 12 AP-2014]